MSPLLPSFFWISIQVEYPELSMKAVDVLLQFSTLWLCELRFSALVNVKTKNNRGLRKKHWRTTCGLVCTMYHLELMYSVKSTTAKLLTNNELHFLK